MYMYNVYIYIYIYLLLTRRIDIITFIHIDLFIINTIIYLLLFITNVKTSASSPRNGVDARGGNSDCGVAGTAAGDGASETAASSIVPPSPAASSASPIVTCNTHTAPTQ